MILLIPAIDLLRGKCVRLLQGSYEHEQVYFDDPVKTALAWQSQEARLLHVVDLDAARGGSEGRADNRSEIRGICQALSVPVQVGGGVRTIQDIEAAFQIGVSRVVLGTATVRRPEMVSEAIRRFTSDRVAVGIDAKDGEVRIEGWTAGSGKDAVRLALDMESRGVRRIIYTDISRDGTLEGPNIAAYQELGRHLKHARITASGGVGGYEDLKRVDALEPYGVDSVIVGRSLYENRFPCQDLWAMHGGS